MTTVQQNKVLIGVKAYILHYYHDMGEVDHPKYQTHCYYKSNVNNTNGYSTY